MRKLSNKPIPLWIVEKIMNENYEKENNTSNKI